MNNNEALVEGRNYVDECRHNFADLANTVLPAYMEQLNTALKSPWDAAVFALPGVGAASLAKKLGLPGDFSGCYVLQDGTSPVYVGISRGVLGRIRQHMTSEKESFSANLPVAMARKRHGLAARTRSEAITADGFDMHYLETQKYLRNLSIGAVEIKNPLELYVFEAYAAMALGTAEWNTFRTH
jgi:hypothetical protein